MLVCSFKNLAGCSFVDCLHIFVFLIASNGGEVSIQILRASLSLAVHELYFFLLSAGFHFFISFKLPVCSLSHYPVIRGASRIQTVSRKCSNPQTLGFPSATSKNWVLLPSPVPSLVSMEGPLLKQTSKKGTLWIVWVHRSGWQGKIL